MLHESKRKRRNTKIGEGWTGLSRHIKKQMHIFGMDSLKGVKTFIDFFKNSSRNSLLCVLQSNKNYTFPRSTPLLSIEPPVFALLYVSHHTHLNQSTPFYEIINPLYPSLATSSHFATYPGNPPIQNTGSLFLPSILGILSA